MRILKLIIFQVITIIPLLAFADAISDARQSALDFGATYKDSAGTTITAQNKTTVPGYTTDNPDQTKYYGGASTDDDAKAKIKSSNEGDLMNNGLPKRPQVQVSYNDSFLNQSKAIEGNPDEVIKMLTGTYGECKPLTYTSIDSEIRTCDEYEDRTGGSCVVGQEVVVDAKHNYQCSKERKFTDKTCDKNLALTCSSWGACSSSSGAVTVSGEVTTYNYPYIDVGVNWTGGGSCDLNVRNTNIYISDLSLIDSFRLDSLSWDDTIKIVVNGVIIYKYGFLISGLRCESNRSHSIPSSIDLKRYLVQGNNSIILTVGISGAGFAAARYSLYQKCCNGWIENWEETCPK